MGYDWEHPWASSSLELEDWQGEVEEFAGGVPSPVGAAQQKLVALAESQLGSSETVDVTAATPVFPRSFTLAEMRVKSPVPLEVVVSTNVSVPELPSALSTGDGYIQVTWGSQGGGQHRAVMDVALGWRQAFVASYIRVEWFPANPFEVNPTLVSGGLPGGQTRPLTVSATIGPSSGAPGTALYKTVLGPTVLNAGAVWPFFLNPYARKIMFFSGNTGLRFTWEWQNAAGVTIGRVGVDRTGAGYPGFTELMWLHKPQRAVRGRFTNNNVGAINEVSMLQELNL